MYNELIFLLLAFIVSIISATFGFGSAIIMIPFSAFLLPIKKAIAIITIFFIAGNISKTIILGVRNRHPADKIALLNSI